MKGVYIFFADGFEETEAIVTLDMLIRGGVDVRTVSITSGHSAQSAHGITVSTQLNYSEFLESVDLSGAEKEDFMVFPGGLPGSTNLGGKEDLMEMMKAHYAAGGSVAAICAAPSVVLSQLDGLEGKKMTCYDGFEGPFLKKGIEYSKDGVVVDERVITGRGAGHTVAFGLAIVAAIKGQETADGVAAAIML